MKMACEIFLGILFCCIVGFAVAVIVHVFCLLFDVLKLLKRIADALEKEKEDGK